MIAAVMLGLSASPLRAVPRDEIAVYLMRGFLDLSTGLDDLAMKLKHRGIPAVVTTYLAESEVASMALRDYKSRPGRKIVLVGHSLGANAVIHVAQTLQKAKVPVELIVVFSPASSNAVPSNVARAINYYQSDGIWNTPYTRGAGFKGSLRNVDLAKESSVHHLNIEKVARLHAATIHLIITLSEEQPEKPTSARSN